MFFDPSKVSRFDPSPAPMVAGSLSERKTDCTSPSLFQSAWLHSNLSHLSCCGEIAACKTYPDFFMGLGGFSFSYGGPWWSSSCVIAQQLGRLPNLQAGCKPQGRGDEQKGSIPFLAALFDVNPWYQTTGAWRLLFFKAQRVAAFRRLENVQKSVNIIYRFP